uniref:Uncharacterized protein LOC110200315 isoform X1 n=1 Tax=Phascolarctos cinereus TaxID=38626 RepID=A0A6P5JAR4_PHACI|nr:uncharacterized protein LOC110200315 isoform X1 [Phascolarctos cinereus]
MSKESRERGRETPPQPSRSTLLQSPPRWPGSSQLAGLRGVRTTPPSSRSPPSPLRSTPQSSADGRGGGQAGSAGPERRGRKRETVETYFWLAFWPSPWISCCRLAESLSSSLTPEAATRYLHLPSIVNSGHLRTCAQSLQSDTPRRGQKNFPMYSPSSPSPSSPSSSLAAEALSTGWRWDCFGGTFSSFFLSFFWGGALLFLTSLVSPLPPPFFPLPLPLCLLLNHLGASHDWPFKRIFRPLSALLPPAGPTARTRFHRIKPSVWPARRGTEAERPIGRDCRTSRLRTWPLGSGPAHFPVRPAQLQPRPPSSPPVTPFPSGQDPVTWMDLDLLDIWAAS